MTGPDANELPDNSMSSRAPTSWIITLVVAAGIAVLSGIVAAGGDVPAWETAVFHALNDLPDRLQGPMWVFQLAGLLFLPLVVAAVAALFHRWRLVVALIAFVPLKLFVEKVVVKNLVERQRPGTTICGYSESDPNSFDVTCAHFRDVPLEGLSFVSGHAIIAWGVATVLWPALPRTWRWVPAAIASLNAIARVYLGAHNPLDVIGGGAVGVAVGAILVMATGLARESKTA